MHIFGICYAYDAYYLDVCHALATLIINFIALRLLWHSLGEDRVLGTSQSDLSEGPLPEEPVPSCPRESATWTGEVRK